MKPCFIFLVTMMTFLLPGCAEEGDAVLFTLNLRFVTEEGSDFFESDTSYFVEPVTLGWLDNDGLGIDEPIDEQCTFDGISYFSEGGISAEYYILFGNGDRDTLFIDHIESLGKFQDNLNDAQGKLDFYYNGELIDTWDFDKEPELGFGMRPICGWSVSDIIARPQVLTIIKKPQPEEFGN